MIAAGRRSKCFWISWVMISSSTLSVPNVSIMIETGFATPMAYASWTSKRSARPAATTFFAT